MGLHASKLNILKVPDKKGRRIDPRYVDIRKIVPAGETEHFAVEHFTLSEDKVKFAKMRSAFGGDYMETYGLEPGEYIRLRHKGGFNDIIMSDTPMELRTNAEFVEKAKGHVLVGGLGLGIVLLAIEKKKEVKSITVIEKEGELLDLVAKHLPCKKSTVIMGDLITQTPAEIMSLSSIQKFDTIYFDIWDHISGDNWEQMKKLHRTYRKYLSPGGWMKSWRQVDCQRLAKEDRDWM